MMMAPVVVVPRKKVARFPPASVGIAITVVVRVLPAGPIVDLRFNVHPALPINRSGCIVMVVMFDDPLPLHHARRERAFDIFALPVKGPVEIGSYGGRGEKQQRERQKGERLHWAFLVNHPGRRKRV
jgi:hypothetical protein